MSSSISRTICAVGPFVRSPSKTSGCVFTCRSFDVLFPLGKRSFVEKSLKEKTYDDVDKMYSLLKHFKTAMLTTSRSDDRRLKCRPMFIGSIDQNCCIEFAASIPVVNVEELKFPIAVSLQERDRFVSLSGKAEVLDQKEADKRWTEAWRLFFPKGKQDPCFKVVRMHPLQGEFWDYSASTVIKFLFQESKNVATGKHPNAEDGERVVGAHKKVDLLTDKDKAEWSVID